MALSVGSRIGPYEVETLLGSGGMGEVYRARDTNLGREVAIKVLPEAFAQDTERLARFEREAKALAALNHPNVAIIHGLEKGPAEAGHYVRALVMELVEGPTLADRVATGPIPLDEALPIATQIAEALEAAHEQGIVHRDLKPANVKVRDDGMVKVLDFGLAKLIDSGSGTRDSGLDDHIRTMSPTITTPAMTQLGMILGTAAYMAPEQARGKPVDKRSDIWAFGCVLFEMLAGRKAFDGEDVTDTIAAVVRAEPKWEALPADLPPSIPLLLRRCLEKDRKKRVGDISTALFIMKEQSALPGPSPAPEIVAPPAKWGQIARYALAVTLTAAITAGVVWMLTRPDPPRVSRLELTTSGASALAVTVNVPHLAITRDGSSVIYVGGSPGEQTLFVRKIDQLEPTLLTNGASFPFVSPDGEWVGFAVRYDTLRKVAITGGPSVEITQLDGAPRGATWGPDDTIVFATNRGDTGLFRVSAAGGTPVVLTRPEKGTDHFRPWFLPDGRAVLFTIVPESSSRRAESQVAVLDLRSSANTPKVLVRGGGDARYVSTGHLVYVADNSLRAVRFDLDRLEPVGAAVPVLASVNVIGGFLGDFEVSDDGTIAYLAETTGGVAERTLTWVDRQGKGEPISAQSRAYLYPRISPDGTRVALDVRDQENDIWVWDLLQSNITRVTKHEGIDRLPVWAADGQFLFFSSNREGTPVIFRQRADGTGEAERLTQSSGGGSVAQHPVSLSADGTELLFQQGPGIQSNDLMALRVDSPGKADAPNVRPVVNTPDGDANGVFSPDGRWLAYQSNESGNWDIYVRPRRDLERGTRFTVSTGGGTQPRWARDGRELFYLSPQNEMMSVRVGSGETWSPGKPVKLFDAAGYYTGGTANPYFNYDVAKDGRFLMIKPKGDPAGEGAATTNLIVIQHWFEELKRLVPR
jgi:serine/threonine-protein kinase